MIVTIHQPEHLPWLGLLDKVRQTDCFIVLDTVQYRKRYFQNRNRVRSSEGELYLTVPVKVKGRFDQRIQDVLIDNQGNPRWAEKCWNSLRHCYGKAAHWARYAGFFEEIYKRTWERLASLNEALLGYLLESFGIRVKILHASELAPAGEKGDLILDLCRKAGAKSYFSGVSGKEYLDREAFGRAGIELRFQEFHHPIYRQLYEPFLPCMSSVDLLFNHGPQGLHILKGIGVETVKEVYL